MSGIASEDSDLEAYQTVCYKCKNCTCYQENIILLCIHVTSAVPYI